MVVFPVALAKITPCLSKLWIQLDSFRQAIFSLLAILRHYVQSSATKHQVLRLHAQWIWRTKTKFMLKFHISSNWCKVFVADGLPVTKTPSSPTSALTINRLLGKGHIPFMSALRCQYPNTTLHLPCQQSYIIQQTITNALTQNCFYSYLFRFTGLGNCHLRKLFLQDCYPTCRITQTLLML